ncbi:hypothetical protein EAD96_28100 [Micromonospora sp. BL1]|uniref:beta-ketoacyl synthase N-terminal-like domain-containing protein n=1 Tax=Micromonospora sp. BL1 TaxID=2478709 RepID=UPI000EF5BC55|nr:hypothetical protein EAD96_28100 [Micromonospora sp. BL1]
MLVVAAKRSVPLEDVLECPAAGGVHAENLVGRDQPVDETEPRTPAIAVIGMAGRFPDAPDLDTFWDNLGVSRRASVSRPYGIGRSCAHGRRAFRQVDPPGEDRARCWPGAGSRRSRACCLTGSRGRRSGRGRRTACGAAVSSGGSRSLRKSRNRWVSRAATAGSYVGKAESANRC